MFLNDKKIDVRRLRFFFTFNRSIYSNIYYNIIIWILYFCRTPISQVVYVCKTRQTHTASIIVHGLLYRKRPVPWCIIIKRRGQYFSRTCRSILNLQFSRVRIDGNENYQHTKYIIRRTCISGVLYNINYTILYVHCF